MLSGAGRLTLTVLAIAVALGAGCAPSGASQVAMSPTPRPTATAQPPIEPTPAPSGVAMEQVTFKTEDNKMLDGRLMGQGTKGVLLAHMRPSDQTAWFDMAWLIAQSGYLVLTFDFRGYGVSDGPIEPSVLDRDVRGGLKFLRERGATRVALIGASMGGTAVLKVATAEELAGVVSLSAPSRIDNLQVTPQEIGRIRAPKLFIAAEGDDGGSYLRAAQTFLAAASGTKELRSFPGTAHGTDLLVGEQGQPVRHLLLEFVTRSMP